MEILDTVKVISECEFDTLVDKAYPNKAPFDSQEYFEWPNGTEYLCKDMTGERDQATQNVEDWASGDGRTGWVSPWAIVQCLISKGHASPGHYIIQVSA